jgi:hypothetical protein
LYSHYDGRIATDVATQRYIINAGTGLAFLVKMFLAIATGTAYVQQFWLNVKHKPNSFDAIDTLYSVLGNAILFWNLNLWFRNLMLAGLALVTWYMASNLTQSINFSLSSSIGSTRLIIIRCLPLASVVTPGTITVQPTVKISNTSIQPPQPLYNSANYSVLGQTEHGDCTMEILGPMSEPLRIALAATAQQAILQIPSTIPNSSYNVEFLGPAVSCSTPPAQNVSAFNESLVFATNHSYFGEGLFGVTGLLYNAWVPHRSQTGDTVSDLANPDWNNGTITTEPDNPNWGVGGASVYVYLPTDIVKREPIRPKGVVLLSCTLHNSTYNVDFDYKNSQQSVTVNSINFHEEVANPYDYSCYDLQYPNEAYISIMWAFTKILVGCATDSGGDDDNTATYTSTLVGATSLRRFIEGGFNATSAVVASELESLFQNITISMLSSEQFM